MKVLKVILFILLGIFALYVITCAMGPKKLELSESMTINAAPETIYEEISDFNQWASWSPWNNRDMDMVNTFEGTPGTVGHIMKWTSKKQGNGEQAIVEVKPNELLRTSLKFADWDGLSYADMVLTPAGDSTKITWTMDGSEIPFMGRGAMLIMGMTKMVQKDYQEGLKKLKQVAESKPRPMAIVTELIDMPDMNYVGVMFKGINENAIDSSIFSSSYAKIMAAVPPANIGGMPMSIAHNYNEKEHTMDLEIAMPVISAMPAEDGLTSGMIPGGKAVKHVYTGPYSGTGPAWGALMNYVMKNHAVRYDGIEMYANDSMTVKDESQYITWLIVPVK